MTPSRRARPEPRTAPRTAPAVPAPPRVRRRLRTVAWRGRFTFAALALGAAAGVTVHEISPPRPDEESVVVVDRPLAAGTTLASGDLRTVRLAAAAVPPDALRDVSAAVGRTVAVDVTPGTVVSAPVLSTDLAAHAPPGTVIAAVRLAEPALADLLEPGMRVDLLAPSTQDAPSADPSGTDPSGAASEAAPGTYLARGAVVQPVPRASPAGEESGALALGSSGDDAGSDLVLVAVTPDEAAVLANMAGWSAISAVLVH